MMLRSFIAVELPEGIQQAISLCTARLKAVLPGRLVRWVAPQNIHLTLQFLGEVSPADLDRLADALQAETASHAGFEGQVSGLGIFPDRYRPRVLWVGMQAPDDLPTLQRGVQAVTTRLGFPADRHAFSPHLTIGRVNQDAERAEIPKIQPALQKADPGLLGSFIVESIHIFKSDLRPSGPIYTRLHTLPLSAGQAPQAE